MARRHGYKGLAGSSSRHYGDGHWIGACISINHVQLRHPLIDMFIYLVTVVIAADTCWGQSTAVPFARATAQSVTSPSTAPGDPPTGGVTPKLEPSGEALALSDAFANAAAAIRPSVVRLEVEGTSEPSNVTAGNEHAQPALPDLLLPLLDLDASGPTKRPLPTQGTGAGIIIDAQGDVLTGYQLLRGAKKVTIKLPGQRAFNGRVIGTDPLTDVGVVRFDHPPPDLVAARLGDPDTLRIGQWVIVVGSPLGLDQTVTAGIVSGAGETGDTFRFNSGEQVRRYIQTDAVTNPGSSGGPLVNLRGEVLGLNTVVSAGPGGSYSFAIPINEAVRVAAILIKEGRVRYPYLGVAVVSIRDIPQSWRDRLDKRLPPTGAVVAEVVPGGPADVAGLRPGDAVTGIAGHPVQQSGTLVRPVSDQAIGTDVVLDYVRAGQSRSVHVRVGEYPVELVTAEGRVGVVLENLTTPLSKSLGLNPSTTGALVIAVMPGGAADRSGLAVGDVIGQIDHQSVTDTEDAVAAMRAGKGARLLRVVSATGTRFVSVTPR